MEVAVPVCGNQIDDFATIIMNNIVITLLILDIVVAVIITWPEEARVKSWNTWRTMMATCARILTMMTIIMMMMMWQSQISITIFGEDCWRPRCDRIRASVSALFTASAWSACWHYQQFITKKDFTTVRNVNIWQISPAYVAQPFSASAS